MPVNGQQVQTTAEDVTVIASGFCGKNNLEDIQWTLTSDGVLTISGTGEMINYDSSSTRRPPWYANKAQITSAVISEGITTVGDYCFYQCSYLTSVQIPRSITAMGRYVFESCSNLTAVDLPDTLTTMGYGCFVSCSSLTSVRIPDGVAVLPYRTFEKCSKLTEVVLPDGLTEIGRQAFIGCSKLTSLDIPDSVSSIGSEAFKNCSSLTSITIPEGVTTIDTYTFSGCSNLLSASLPDSVTTIGYYSFANCSKLTSLSIPDNVTSIDGGAFNGCSQLSSITIPDGVTKIGSSAFYNCSALTSIAIPDGVTKIETNTFNGCSSLEYVSIGSGVTEIGSGAFANCPMLASLDIDSENQAFCTLDGVLFSKDMTTLIFYPAASTRTEYQIPDSVTTIAGSAFSGSSNLVSISIPNSVTSIGDSAFSGCTSLAAVDIPNSVTSLGSSTFQGCTSLTEVTLPDGITTIAYNLFYGCTALEKVDIPDSVTSIGTSAFLECKKLKSIDLPSGLTNIGYEAFYRCYSLKEIVIPDGVTGIGNYAFYECSSLEKVSIPDSVTTIGSYSFKYCSSLKEINIPDKVTVLQYGVFERCKALSKIVLPSGIVSLENYAFQYSGLREVTLHNGEISIGTTVFQGTQLACIVIGNGVNRLSTNTLTLISKQSGMLNEILYEGPNYFTFEGADFTCGRVTLTQGDYYVDEHDVLYRLNSNGTAELLFAPEQFDSSAYSVLSSIPAENDPEKTCTVTQIGNNAFYNCANLSSVTIPESVQTIGDSAFKYCTSLEAVFIPESVTHLGPHAFAFCTKLASVNGQTSLETVMEFWKTRGADTTTFQETVLWNQGYLDYFGVTTGIIELYDDTGRKITLSLAQTHDVLTGETVTSSLTIDEGNEDSHSVVRVYFQFEDEHGSINLPLGDNTFDGIQGKVCKADALNTYYIEIAPLKAGETLSLSILSSYMNKICGGGAALIWADALTTDEAAALGNGLTYPEAVHRPTWSTQPDVFPMTKAQSSSAYSFIRFQDSENLISLKEMKFKISMGCQGITSALGEDYMTSMDFFDTMTLPEHFFWNPEVIEAIRAGNYRATTQGMFVTINGKEMAIASLGYSANISNPTLSVDDDGNIQFGWTYSNPTLTNSIEKITEIPTFALDFTFNSNVILADADKLNELVAEAGKSITFEFINNVSATQHFSFSEDQYQEASAVGKVSVGTSTYSISKYVVGFAVNQTATVNMGDPLVFDLRLSQSGPLPVTNLDRIEDVLPDYYYIAPSDMETMFYQDTYGQDLMIEITNAALYPRISNPVTGTDGQTHTIDQQEQGIDVPYEDKAYEDPHVATAKATITISWSEDRSYLVLSLGGAPVCTIGEGQACGSIQSALDSIGYFVTADAVYRPVWDLRGQKLYTAESRIYYVRSTAKDTFMRLTGDQDWFIVDSTTYQKGVYNYAYAYTTDESYKSANRYTTILRDFTLFKDAYLDGTSIDELNQVEAGNILTYRCEVSHSGKNTYDALPLVDNMEGAQVLLVSVEENTSLADQGLEVLQVAGKDYYLMNKPGTYSNIVVGNHLADRVVVTQSEEGLDTMIYWYLTNVSGTTTVTAEYLALVSPEKSGLVSEGATYTVNNEVWLNDHQTHRLYDRAYVNGSILRINKYIVTNMDERDPASGTPHDSALDDLEKRTNVGVGETVTYRLMLQGIGSDSITIKGDAIYDTLPESLHNYWTEENIRVSYVAGPDSSFSIENTREDNQDWYIETADPDENGVTQQYLRWNEEFSVTLDGTLYIYVALTFPADDTWDEYSHVYSDTELVNTFHVYQLQDEVFHYLEVPGKVFLQKGVLQTGAAFSEYGEAYNHYYIVDAGEESLWYYANDAQFRGIVTYYVVLYNSGDARVYLSDIQDVLPLGFTYNSLYYSSSQIRPSSRSDTPTYNHERTSLVSIANGTVPAANFKDAAIRASTSYNENGQQVVTFWLGNLGNDGNFSYDPDLGKYYLGTGEALVFAYNVNTNGYADTQDVADNVVAMPFFDYNGGGVVLDTTTPADRKQPANKLSNNGNRTVITNGQAALIGMNTDSTDDSTQWLCSEVQLTRGSIVPGITKAAEAPFAHVTAPVSWSINISNSGTEYMRGYTITDVMMAPYQFTGTVSYRIDCAEWKYQYAYIDNLFTFGNRSANDNVVTVSSGNGSAELVINGDYQELLTKITVASRDIYGYISTRSYNSSIFVRLCRDENGNEILSIRFPEEVGCQFNIPANGTALMTLQTQNFGNVFRNTTYFNTSYLTPSVNQHFDPGTVSQGNYTIYEELDSVVSEANVAVSYGYATASLKSVAELSDPDNTASSIQSTNYIVLPENESVFRYTLEVQNTGGNEQSKAMDLLVLIDNLPEVGDHTTFYTDIPRRSEFRVDFAVSPDVVVSVNDKPLDPSLYTVEYSAKTEFGESDWKGNASEDWKAGTPSGARSLRIIIKDEAGQVIPAGATINVSFNAVIGADSGTLKPSLIAWNSFGYHYSLVGEATELEAAPQKVGIKIPSVPVLVKELQNSAGSAYTASEQLTFRFVIYEGDAVTLPEIISEADVYAALDSRNFTVAEVTVEPGKSSSEPLLLNTLHLWSYSDGVAVETNEIWNWKNLTRYTILELPSENEDYYFGSMNKQTRNNFTFSYSAATDRTLTCVNIRDIWQFNVIKRCATTQGPLSGAVFGLYSPNPDELISNDTYRTLSEALDNAPEKSISLDGTVWYLTDIRTTPANGTVEFTDLTAERYYLLELQAPAGYFLNEEPGQFITIEQASAEVIISNQAGVKLPATGGLGSEFFSILGTILMGSTAYLGCSRKRKHIR